MSTPEYPKLPEIPLHTKIEHDKEFVLSITLLVLMIIFAFMSLFKIFWNITNVGRCLCCKKSNCNVQQDIEL